MLIVFFQVFSEIIADLSGKRKSFLFRETGTAFSCRKQMDLIRRILNYAVDDNIVI